jgi:hypothetical protein
MSDNARDIPATLALLQQYRCAQQNVQLLASRQLWYEMGYAQATAERMFEELVRIISGDPL